MKTLTEKKKEIVSNTRCQIKGCKELTSNRKPYCIDHIQKYSYIKRVLNELDSREKEMKKATKQNGWKKIDIKGGVTKEIIEIVSKNTVSPQRLAILAEIDLSSLKNYLIKLEKKKILKTINAGNRHGASKQLVVLFNQQ